MLKIDQIVDKEIGQVYVIYRNLPRSSGNYKHVHNYTCLCKICSQLCVKTYKQLKSVRPENLHCGCRPMIKTHGRSNTPTYLSWEMMKQRCLNKNATAYNSYGGAGIKICEEWEHNFQNFLEDMGERPLGSSLDRIDNSKGYCAENCRWATYSLQQYNRKKTKENTSGKIGVSWYKNYKKWKAYICHKNKIINLGYFKDKEMAILERLEAEIKYFGYNKD